MTHLPVPSPADLIAGLVPGPLDPLLTRPLALHHGRAYAAVWPRLRRQPDDPALTADLKHAHSRADSPPAPDPFTLLIVRDDGLLSRPVAPADALVRLNRLPPLPADRLWTTTGLQAYCAGRRPDPAQVFATLTALFDRFIDFTGSLAPQPLMTELLAAYVLATWFLPAFTTFSHLWLLGDTGAGKSRLLHLLTRLAHLGAVVPPYAPSAPLRDLAALGATLALDNADGLYTSLLRGLAFRPAAATLRQGLFLAGARRDVLFPLHQRLALPAADPAAPAASLSVRPPPAVALTHLDVFGPRLFAAQQPPHPAVATRALFIQLLRSTDRARCLADPADPAAWPVDPRALTDDLWALSLAHLPAFPAHVARTAAGSALVGAYFQTWHPLLAVASWLTAHGVPGLLDRLRALAQDYPRRTVALGPQGADTTSLAIQAIYGFMAMQVEKNISTYTALTQRGTRDTRGTSNSSRPQRGTRGTRGTSNSSRPQRGTRGTRGTSNSAQPAAAPLDPTLVAHLNQAPYFFTASMILGVMQKQARNRAWHAVAAALEPIALGRILSSLGLIQQKKHNGRFYTLTLPDLARLIDAYRLNLPPILSTYPRFKEDTLRAEIPAGSPGAPLRPPSPQVIAALGPLLRTLLRPPPVP